MKQRIRVAAIIRDSSGAILVMKRNHGRSENSVLWEIPTGKIMFGEQPEESITNLIEECVGGEIEELKLKDAVSFVALEGASRLNNLFIVFDVRLKNYKLQPAEKYIAFKFVKDINNSNIKLNEASLTALEIEGEKKTGQHVANNARAVANSATVYVDGASRGNPGPAGIGYYIVDENGQTIKRGGTFIGFATSRVAEYCAMRNGINQAIEAGLKTVRFVSDSLMLVNHINGIYKLKNRDIVDCYNEIKEKLKTFEAVSVVHMKRSQNAAADKEANLAIDRVLKNK